MYRHLITLDPSRLSADHRRWIKSVTGPNLQRFVWCEEHADGLTLDLKRVRTAEQLKAMIDSGEALEVMVSERFPIVYHFIRSLVREGDTVSYRENGAYLLTFAHREA